MTKPKLVRKSPEKNKSDNYHLNHHSNRKSSSNQIRDTPTMTNARFKRAAANKASDRINRESRGRLSLSSSSSHDSRISDLGQDELANKDISSDDSDFEPSKTEPNNNKIYDFDPTASSSPVVKIPLKRKGGLITPNS